MVAGAHSRIPASKNVACRVQALSRFQNPIASKYDLAIWRQRSWMNWVSQHCLDVRIRSNPVRIRTSVSVSQAGGSGRIEGEFCAWPA